ncbi:(R)-mandelonitrile lyase [Spirosoma koreense]
MKNVRARTGFIITISLASLYLHPCQAQTKESGTKRSTESAIFPKGEKGPAQTFTGTVWVQKLVAADSTYQLASGSVTFEPGARSFWHSHPSGQILLVTDGVGYHQLKGKPREIIRKGDVVKCPPNIPHWHGASADSPMTHIHIVPNTEKGIVNWLQAVTDAEYNSSR